MIRTNESWNEESRFFLPNEDAHLTAAILRKIPSPMGAAFVGGSGFLLLQSLAFMAPDARVCFVDVSPWQAGYFEKLRDALALCRNASELRDWFSENAYPGLAAHCAGRGMAFSLVDVFSAMNELFGISFLFKDEIFDIVKAKAPRVLVHVADICEWLNEKDRHCDFVHLSNICDYLPPERFIPLFAACAGMRAHVQLLTTEICGHEKELEEAWEQAGFHIHTMSSSLDRANRALGSATLDKQWNRKGHARLLSHCLAFEAAL